MRGNMAAVLGLDISKQTIDACLIDARGEISKKVTNNAKGFAQLRRWLTNRRTTDVHVCMEATGSYYENVAEDLADAGYLVSVVNPAQIKAFSQSLLARAKTDRLDARLIAAFCQKFDPSAWKPPSAQERKLRGIVRFSNHLKQTRASYTVQRQTPNVLPEVKKSIDELIDGMDDQIETLEREIEKLIEDDPDLRKRRDLLCTIDAIGTTTAATILAEMPHIDEFRDSKAVAAFAGLSFRTKASGTSVRGRGGICKIGNARLRKALWWPAIVGLRYNVRLRQLAERLAAAGKPKKKIIVAAMRQLLVLAYGVLKSGRPFDGALTAS
jgi:transposase